MNRAVFLDRDGVLIRDVNLLTKPEQICILPEVAPALCKLKQHGFYLVVVTNQTVVARGLANEEDVAHLHAEVDRLLRNEGGPSIDAWYFCPHHPQATIADFRVNCQCRKPKPGMLLQAGQDHHLNLKDSFLVGDRMSDICAGARAGCRTVLVLTGEHLAPPIETSEPMEEAIKPDYVSADLGQAVQWILQAK